MTPPRVAASARRKTSTASVAGPNWAWNGHAPPSLSALAPWQEEEAHRSWAAYLRSRPAQFLQETLANLRPEHFLWGASTVLPSQQLDTLVHLARFARTWPAAAGRGARKKPQGWDDLLALVQGQEVSSPYQSALAALLVAWALPWAATWCSRTQWWELLARLFRQAEAAQRLPLETEPLRRQLLGGELPLLLAGAFGQLAPLGPLADRARRVLSAGLIELCDGQGMVHGRHLQVFPALLGCWTRCLMLPSQSPPWTTKAQDQYDWAVRQMLRLLQSDGRWCFHAAKAPAGDRQLVQQMLQLAGDRYDWAMARRSLPGAWQRPLRAHLSQQALPELLPPPCYQSDWARVALLQPQWERGTPRLWVNHAEKACRWELSNRGALLLQGELHLELRRNGQLLRPQSQWDCLLWEADADGDYLELELELSDSTTLYRHVFLAREDRFLLLADAVCGPDEPASWEYGLSLPLAAGVSWQAEAETTEGVLLAPGGNRLALLMPIGAPEWRVGCPWVPLQQQEQRLWLRHRYGGCRFVVPLFFDLDSRRARRQRTWRRLTVAQDLRPVEPDQACGFRVQSGSQQWLFYRGLDGVHSRTVLGAHLFCELSLRRFLPDGSTEMLIETLPE